MTRRKNTVVDFWKKVDKNGPIQPHMKDCCWEWTTGKGVTGYGIFHIEGRQWAAHRFSYEYFIKSIPVDIHILHRCDNTSCVRPTHLFEGTHQDNMDDKMKKCRNNNMRGEKHGMAKKTEKEIKAIKNDRRPQWIIAIDYNIHQTQVSNIKTGKQWGWL